MKERHGAAAVVLRGGSALLVRRANPPDAGLWGYPGGHVDLAETAEAAAIRELREETGVLASPVRVITTLRVGASEGRPFRLDMVLCTWISGAPHAADDVLEAAWVPFADIRAGLLRMSRDVDTVLDLALGGPGSALPV